MEDTSRRAFWPSFSGLEFSRELARCARCRGRKRSDAVEQMPWRGGHASDSEVDEILDMDKDIADDD
ncbi:MAG TPA: hypothetical protein VGH98_19770 [Gemmatimonadaceae bacterium]|jgi:hypothetical protein